MCEYCENNKLVHDSKEWTVSVDNKYGEKELYIEINLGGYESISENLYININYCPMCGNLLKNNF